LEEVASINPLNMRHVEAVCGSLPSFSGECRPRLNWLLPEKVRRLSRPLRHSIKSSH
jgi:hypothetical protein